MLKTQIFKFLLASIVSLYPKHTDISMVYCLLFKTILFCEWVVYVQIAIRLAFIIKSHCTFPFFFYLCWFRMVLLPLFVWCPFKVYDLLNVSISFMKPQNTKHNIWLISRPFDWNQINFEHWITKRTTLSHIVNCIQMNDTETYDTYKSNDNCLWINRIQLSVINRLDEMDAGPICMGGGDEEGLPHNNKPSLIKTKRTIRFILFCSCVFEHWNWLFTFCTNWKSKSSLNEVDIIQLD